MNTPFIFSRFTANSKTKVFILSTSWSLGLLLGILSAGFAPNDFLLLKSFISVEPVPVLVFFISLLPVAVAAISIYYRLFFLSCLLCFWVAFSRGLCGILLYIALGSGAWLARTLLLFPGMFAAVFMWWLFARHCSYAKPTFYRDVRFSGIVLSIVSVVYIYLLSPFLTALSNNI